MVLCALAGETRAPSATARVAVAQERRMGHMLKNIEKGKKSGMQTSQNKFHCVIASVLILGLVVREHFGLFFFKFHDLLGREYSFQCPLLRSYFGVLE